MRVFYNFLLQTAICFLFSGVKRRLSCFRILARIKTSASLSFYFILLLLTEEKKIKSCYHWIAPPLDFFFVFVVFLAWLSLFFLSSLCFDFRFIFLFPTGLSTNLFSHTFTYSAFCLPFNFFFLIACTVFFFFNCTLCTQVYFSSINRENRYFTFGLSSSCFVVGSGQHCVYEF